MKLRLLQILTLAFAMTCAFISGYHWPKGIITEDDPRWDCRVHGNRICGPDPVREVVSYIEGCSLRDAHAGKCTIPCGSDQDCVEKNGSREAY